MCYSRQLPPSRRELASSGDPSSRFGLSPKFSTVVEKVVENQQDPAGDDLNTSIVSLLGILTSFETVTK